jgi:hypothetical protein
LKKETEDTKRWKDLPCSWIGRFNIENIAKLLKVISIDPYQNLMTYFTEIEKKNLRIHRKAQKTEKPKQS